MDALLLEGTLGREARPYRPKATLLEATACAGRREGRAGVPVRQNISRAVSFKAAQSSWRWFVPDFTAHVLTELSRCSGGSTCPGGQFKRYASGSPQHPAIDPPRHQDLVEGYQFYEMTLDDIWPPSNEVLIFVRPGMGDRTVSRISRRHPRLFVGGYRDRNAPGPF